VGGGGREREREGRKCMRGVLRYASISNRLANAWNEWAGGKQCKIQGCNNNRDKSKKNPIQIQIHRHAPMHVSECTHAKYATDG
jgi:hypothetical protein